MLVSAAFEFLRKSVNSYGELLYDDFVPQNEKGNPLIVLGACACGKFGEGKEGKTDAREDATKTERK